MKYLIVDRPEQAKKLLENRRERRENKAQGGEKPECTKGVHEDFEPPEQRRYPKRSRFYNNFLRERAP